MNHALRKQYPKEVVNLVSGYLVEIVEYETFYRILVEDIDD